MHKHTQKRWIVAALLVSMVMVYGVVPLPKSANAVDSITNAKDTISTSQRGATATHRVTFTTGTSTPINGYWELEFDAAFTGVAAVNADCAYGSTFNETANGNIIICTRTGTALAPTTTSIVVTSVVNPAPVTPTSYLMQLRLYNATGVLKERVQMRVAILQNITMTASVNANLTFTVAGVAAGQVVNIDRCDLVTTATTTPFGTLSTTASTTVCQELSVATNADDGYVVTVEQDHELLSDSGSNINSFNNSLNSTGSTTPVAWAAPFNVLDRDWTYGHMGVTTNDSDLSTLSQGSDFTGGKYAGLNGTNPMVIMGHTGPSDGTTQNKGLARVAYTAQINTLQEAGDYESRLTYICTPTF